MKAKRYMKPPSCRKPATVIVPYAGQALDGQRPTRTISEPPADLELFFNVTFSKPLRPAVVGRRGWAKRGDKRTWAVGRKRTVADRYKVGEMVVAPGCWVADSAPSQPLNARTPAHPDGAVKTRSLIMRLARKALEVVMRKRGRSAGAPGVASGSSSSS